MSIFIFTDICLLILVGFALHYVSHSSFINLFNDRFLKEIAISEEVAISVWFTMLGATAKNFYGLEQYQWERASLFRKWWNRYIIRFPLAIIVGIVIVVLLRMVPVTIENKKFNPSLLILMIVSFGFGTKEHHFYYVFQAIFNKINKLMLDVIDAKEPKEKAPKKEKHKSKKKK